MSKRSYTLIDEDAARAMGQVGDLVWPNGEPVRLGDFGRRLKISGVLFQGEEKDVLVFGPNGVSRLGVATHFEPTLETWCAIIHQTDDPVIFEQDETGTIKAVQRKVRFQVSGGVQWEMFERDGFRCMYCGKKGGKGVPLTIDHFVPLEQGGANEARNYLTSCRRCQKKKGARDPEEYCEAESLDYEGLSLYLQGKGPMSFIAHLV
jgi:5-methylcytosine-specific restriction endonuclease McrA